MAGKDRDWIDNPFFLTFPSAQFTQIKMKINVLINTQLKNVCFSFNIYIHI